MRYAQTTEVSADKSEAEIKKLLLSAGATGVVTGWQPGEAVIGFILGGRHYRYSLRLPKPEDFRHTSERGIRRNDAAMHKAYDQVIRTSWRELVLLIKAKLVAVSSGIVTVEEEFLAWAVVPNGQTVRDWLLPQLKQAEQEGRIPPMLPGPRS